MEVQENYSEKLKDFTEDAFREFYYNHIEKEGEIDLKNLKLLTSVPAKGFGQQVKDSHTRLKVNKNPVICLYEKYGDPHSSALPIAFHEAIKAKEIKVNDQVLFISAGSGLTVGAGLYIL